MTQSAITIRNIYMMMAYAFQMMQRGETTKLETESFNHLHELLAAILIEGAGRQVKRGLHHQYVPQSADLTTVRGRINIEKTTRLHATARRTVQCEYDEYLPDSNLNQALKAVLRLLSHSPHVSIHRRRTLERIIRNFGRVTDIQPHQIDWKRFSFNRASVGYRPLLGVCELVVKGMVHSPRPGEHHLTEWIADEHMSSLYERFLLQYYKVHHRELEPAAPRIPWDLQYDSPAQTEQLPHMQSDLVLTSSTKTLIIDAKYYTSNMQQNRWGKSTVISGHLYQLLSYVKNADTEAGGSVSGLLLYAKTQQDAQPFLDITVQKNRLAARTLDLDSPWEDIVAQLERIPASFLRQQS